MITNLKINFKMFVIVNLLMIKLYRKKHNNLKIILKFNRNLIWIISNTLTMTKTNKKSQQMTMNSHNLINNKRNPPSNPKNQSDLNSPKNSNLKWTSCRKR